MSMLDGGPDLVLVYPEVEVDDGYGGVVRVPAETPVPVRGRVQPSTAAESAAFGQQAETMYRFITRAIPGGAWARIEWDGREWDAVGEPRRSNGSPRTRHMTLWLKARGPRPVEA